MYRGFNHVPRNGFVHLLDLWGVMTGGEQVPEPTLWAPKFLHLPGTCLAPNYNFSNGTILTLCRHQVYMAPPWHLLGTKL